MKKVIIFCSIIFLQSCSKILPSPDISGSYMGPVEYEFTNPDYPEDNEKWGGVRSVFVFQDDNGPYIQLYGEKEYVNSDGYTYLIGTTGSTTEEVELDIDGKNMSYRRTRSFSGANYFYTENGTLEKQ
jgi:hypothetical protein